MAALERLLSAQEAQMEHIESSSESLQSHIEYWGQVRVENILLHAARKRGITAIGPYPVPNLATSAHAAKTAIEMQLMLESLLNSPWGKDPWTLTAVSAESFKIAPCNTLKKHPRRVEVIYDGQPDNKNWYTAWGEIYVPTGDGWTVVTTVVDATGLSFTMQGASQYYTQFAEDAQLFSSTNTWSVYDGEQRYDFPDSVNQSCRPRPESSSTPPAPGRPTSPYSCGTSTDSSVRARPRSQRGGSHTRCRLAAKLHPYSVPASKSLLGDVCRSSSLSSSTEEDLEQSQESCEDLQKTDDTNGKVQVNSDFDLFGGEQQCACLLIQGNGNSVKCLRWRLKRSHRKKFLHITTTFWATGNEGSERCGNGTLLITFPTSNHRKDFLDTVSIPAGLQAKCLRVAMDS